MRTPDILFPSLFVAVQSSGIFEDSKTFVDSDPIFEVEEINQRYAAQKDKKDFDLQSFVYTHFEIPTTTTSGFMTDTSRTIEEHLLSLWPWLTRSDMDRHVAPGSSLIPLKKPYVVPGGRFREIYYWDSFFTMKGLIASGKNELARSMLDNFCQLMDVVGHIPNGNRSYFTSRSQPPFFALMVAAVAESAKEVEPIYRHYLPWIEKEYEYWMQGKKNLKEPFSAEEHVVVLEEGVYLNRYYDSASTPRQESYLEDVELVADHDRGAEHIWQNLRAACESGWDFSSRWLSDPTDLATIETLDIIPIDLNCLLWYVEDLLSRISDDSSKNKYTHLASSRAEAIKKYLWDKNLSFYGDYNWKQKKPTSRPSAAMTYPLFFGLASRDQAASMVQIIENTLLQAGGIVTTLQDCHQQWDFPNGWPPLQWMAVRGLERFGYQDLANEIQRRWCRLCERVYQSTGKMMEKYDVTDLSKTAGGGEYPVQDGFGWTNGVYLDLKIGQGS